jgi:hypothetical protein
MRKLLVGILLVTSLPSFSQLLQDAQAKALISQGLDHLYAYSFKESMDDFNALKAKYPKNPAGYLLSAMQFLPEFMSSYGVLLLTLAWLFLGFKHGWQGPTASWLYVLLLFFGFM